MKGKFASMYEGNRDSSFGGTGYSCRLLPQTLNSSIERESDVQGDALSDQRLFSCVTCGILCFACVAFLQPIEQAAQKPAVAYPCKRDSSSSLSPCPASYHLFSCYMFLFSFCQLQPTSKDTRQLCHATAHA